MRFSFKHSCWILILALAGVFPVLAQKTLRIVRKTSEELTERIIKWQEPVFPPIARQAGAGGAMVVELIIDEQGNVFSAQVVSGHPLLRGPMLQAARLWKFKPVTVKKVPVRLQGRITYAFPSPQDLFGGKTISELEKLVRQKPDSAEAHYDLGIAYSKQNRDDEALARLTEAIRIDPRLGDAHLKLGHLYMKLGQLHAQPNAYETALEAFASAARLRPNSSEAFHALGLATMALGRYQEAIDAFTKSLQVDEPITTSHFALGKCYFLLNRSDEAVVHYQRGLSLYPDSDSGHFGLGEAYFDLERYNEATNELREAIRLSKGPGKPRAHFYLGLAYLRRGNKESALREYEVLKTLDAELASQLINEIRKSSKRNTVS